MTLLRPRPDDAAAPGTSVARSSVLAVILVAQLMVMLDMTIVNVALPDIATALDFTPAGLSWVLSAYTLAFGGLLLLGARSGDILGRRRTFLAGLTVFALASLLGGLVSDGGLLLASRALQGAGAAFAAPATLALLTSLYAEGRDRTRALGLYTAVSIGGAAVGLVAGGMLTDWWSWRGVFYVNVPIGLALVAVAARVLPIDARDERQRHFDLAGALTSTLGMTALVYGFVRAAEHGWTDGTTIAAFVAGALLLASFVVVERRAASPITPLVLFADRTRNGGNLARLLMIASMTGMFFFLTQFLQDVLGYSPLQTGLGFLPLTVMLFVSSQLSARVLVERFGPRAVMVAGIAFSTASLFWLTQLSADSGYLSVLGPLVLLGLGNGTAFVPLTGASLTGVAPELAGAASGLVNVSQQVGGSLGLALLVTVFGSASRSADVPAGATAAETATNAFVHGADAAFTASAVLLVLTMLVALVFVRVGPRSRRETVTAVASDGELLPEAA